MPGRSPHRRSPPPPPLISHHSSERSRAHSPARQRIEMASSSRGRDRREYRPSIRRSRSPVPPKRRSYSPPPIKRKASPIPERELSRRPKISKSPVGSRGESRGAPELRYNSAVDPEPRPVRNVSSSERFRERDYEDNDGGAPKFRGPENPVDYNINDLKKFTIEIVRKPSSNHGDTTINRSIINPEDIAPVRRPGMRGGVDGQKFRGYYNNRGNFNVRGGYSNNHYSQPQKWKNNQEPPKWKNNQESQKWKNYEEEEDSYSFNAQSEGSRPLFRRGDVAASKDKSNTEEYQRIVAIDNSRGSGHDRGHSRERPPPRYSPAPGPSHYEDSRRPYYNERERGHSPYEARHRSPHRDEYVDKHRERRGGSREDVKRADFVVRKKEERRYSPERRLSYERDQRESDLRSRINEKRSDPHPRVDERERERRYESDRERGERHGRPHHSSPPRERRRPASSERHEGSRDRREAWERDRERDREGREREGRRRHSREREPREHSDNHYEDSRRPPKGEYEPKKFYKTYEPKEFIPPPVRGRGMPMRRGVPPIMRGRGGIVRGMSRGFRGAVMVPRLPRGGPFIPRGFPPRFFPPY
ncbi:zinc finger CCCH domain-containing protein 13-like isoform X1 [Macrosteles quadrilineatus]|uniref:zinc finger CCCH domain-containing protein 13-like isoform X1 n=1 Tax=Macrosteles quadrilineatus TaxID=74068 RepID=UPI0023E14C57|nr:zinc finger CCCH domain-containing protein 13-like isoform X1 [Macrosteles quadrilineatus]